MTDLDSIWRRHAEAAGILDQRPDFRFDPRHYRGAIPDAPSGLSALTRHFEEVGRAFGFSPNLYRQLRPSNPDIDAILAGLVIDPELSLAMARGQPDAHELACEVIRLGSPVDAAVSHFAMEFYLATYADIARSGMDPLHHYLLYGAREGRRTLAWVRQSQLRGALRYEADRPTCLIAVHETSRTGAPIVGLDLIREAARTHNVIVVTWKTGPLLPEMIASACEVVVTANPVAEFPYYLGGVYSRIDLCITNSVECWPIIPFLVARGIPFAAYIHEYANYTFPAYKSTYTSLFADLLVFSAEHVRDSWAGRLADVEFDVNRDSVVVPQRALGLGSATAVQIEQARARLSAVLGRDLSKARLVCGAGELQWRKGTDLFVSTAQIARDRDPDAVFLWIGSGMQQDDINFGVWMDHHLHSVGANTPEGNLFLLPAGPHYLDVLVAADMMFLSSRLDPLPNVAFDALDCGCRIVLFEGASGFGDQCYLDSGRVVAVEYANPDAAAAALLSLPLKEPGPATPPRPRPDFFAAISEALEARLDTQRYFVSGASAIDVPILFSAEERDRPLRVREREKMLRYRRRFLWRDLEDVEETLARSDNWVHQSLSLAPYGPADEQALPPFSLHLHAFYTEGLAEDLRAHRALRFARRIVVTTDTVGKSRQIETAMAGADLEAEIRLTSNRGRDVLPFLELLSDFEDDGAHIWGHMHVKRSIGTAEDGEAWRRFLLRILLGSEAEVSTALARIADDGVGLVAPFDPHFVPWNASRALLPRVAHRLPGPLPANPYLFPVGNMFWVRRNVGLAMRDAFGPDYPWPNEPISSDGTEFHLIERLWPAMAAQLGLRSVFVHKLDEKRG